MRFAFVSFKPVPSVPHAEAEADINIFLSLRGQKIEFKASRVKKKNPIQKRDRRGK